MKNIYRGYKGILRIAIEDKGDPKWHSLQSSSETRIETGGNGQMSLKRKQTRGGAKKEISSIMDDTDKIEE